MLCRPPADQGAARLHAALGNAPDDLGDLFGDIPAAGDIVQEKEGSCAAAKHVVHAHGDAVYPDRIMLSEQLGDAQLRSHAVGAGNEDRLLHPCGGQRKQSPEAADIRGVSPRHGPRNMLFHQFYRFIAAVISTPAFL